MTIDIGVTAQQKIIEEVIAHGGEVEFVTENGETYKVHTFKSSEELTVTTSGLVDVLVVAGGGGGGSDNGGGGGGGGVVYRNGYNQLTAGKYQIIVGGGGAGATATSGSTSGTPGANGNSSEIISIPSNYFDAGGSVTFNGSNGYLSVADNTKLRINKLNFTIEAWIYITNFRLYNVIAVKNGPTQAEGWAFAIHSNIDLTKQSLTEANLTPNILEFNDSGTALYTVENNIVYQYDLYTAWDTTSAQHFPRLSVLAQDGTPRGTYLSPDGVYLFMTSTSTARRVFRYKLATPWSIKTATFDQFVALGAQDTVLRAVQFKPDGTAMFVLGNTNNRVYEYSLSTPWDLNTVVYTNNFYAIAQTTGQGDLHFKPDGTGFQILSDVAPLNVYNYQLSTPWDISTTSFIGSDFRSIQFEATPTALRFSNDGSRMFVMGSGSDRVQQYDLTEPWSLKTAKNFAYEFFILEEANPNGFYFGNNGQFLFVVGTASDTVHKYILETPWDISSQILYDSSSVNLGTTYSETAPRAIFWHPNGLSYYFTGNTTDQVTRISVTQPWEFIGQTLLASFSVATQETSPGGLTFRPDGSRMFVTGNSSDSVHQYNLSSPWSLTGASFSGSFSVSAQDTNPGSVDFSADGTQMFVVGITNSRVIEYVLSTPWDITTAAFVKFFNLLTIAPGPWNEARFKPDGLSMYVVSDGTNRRLYELKLTEAWNIDTAVYTALKTFNVLPFDTIPTMLDFNVDGTKMYLGGTTNDIISEFRLETPWDITTAVFNQPFRNFSTDDADIGGIAFKDDGSKLFVVGKGQSLLLVYNLSLPWQIRTASLTQGEFFLELDSLLSLKFSTLGDNLYILGQNSVAQYQLSEPWDISTKTNLFFSLDISSNDRFLTDLKFKSDGTKLYLIGRSRKILIYQMSTPWDLSTAILQEIFDVSSEANQPFGLVFKDNGSRMYVLDRETTTVYEFEFIDPWDLKNLSSPRGKLYWEFQNQLVNSNRPVDLFSWTHVTVSRLSNITKLFINGETVAEFLDNFDYASTGELRIGRGRLTSSNYFAGSISNFRLTINNIEYFSNFVPSTTPLESNNFTALLTANSSTAINDSSSNSFVLFKNGSVIESRNTPFIQPLLNRKLIAFGGGGGNSGQNTLDSRAGGLAGGSGGGGQGENSWELSTTYKMNVGGDTIQKSLFGNLSYEFNIESRLLINNNPLFDFDNNIDYTIETWFYIEGNSPVDAGNLRRACIISGIADNTGSTNSFEFWIDGSATTTGTGFRVALRNNSTTPVTYVFPATMAQREWNHVAFSKYDNILLVYLNGVKIGESSDFVLKTGPGPNPIKIASIFATGTAFYPLIGKLSNLRVSRGIARYKDSQFILPTEPFIDDEYTVLLACCAEDYKDASKNKIAITREGAVAIVSSNTPFSKKRLFSSEFKGSSYIRADSAFATFFTAQQQWTIECWINEATRATDGYWIGINLISNGGNTLLVRNSGVFSGSTTYPYTEAFTTGQWNHFAMTYTGTVLTVYKNGQSVLTLTISLPALNTTVLGIATEFDSAEGGDPGNYYNGYIHDFRVVSSIVYSGNFTPPSDLLEDIPGTTLLCFRNERFIDESSKKTPIWLFGNIGTENISPYTTDAVIPAIRTRVDLDFRFTSLQFNGTTDYIDVASNFSIGTGDFAIEFWAKFTTITADTVARRILSQGANAADRVQIYIADTSRTVNGKTAIRGSIVFFTTADQISTVRAVNDGRWHHIAFTRSSGTLRSFVDGELMDTRTGFTTNLSSTLGYRIGTFATSATQGNYQGKLANIRVSLFNSRYTENFIPLLDNFPIDIFSTSYLLETLLLIQGQEFSDLSINRYTLTPAGSVFIDSDSPFLQPTITTIPLKTAIKSYGNRGGESIVVLTPQGGGGGGGAAEKGHSTNTNVGGQGGAGIYIPAFENYYGGGGGGGNENNINDIVLGGNGGGGNGGGSLTLGFHDAEEFFGGGGGGSTAFTTNIFLPGGNGGSGTVKIKYKSRRPVATTVSNIVLEIFTTVNVAPVTVVGPSDNYNFSINPALPAGLSFDTNTGIISGLAKEPVNETYTIFVRDASNSSLFDSSSFRLIIDRIKIAGGKEFEYTEGSKTYKVHKFTESGTVDFEKFGSFFYSLLGGGGAGGGGTTTADGGGGGGAGGFVENQKSVQIDSIIESLILPDINTIGWQQGTDFSGESGTVVFSQTAQTMSVYAIHVFNTSDNLIVNESVEIEYLLVGGGGGGGSLGGGGGGGFLQGTTTLSKGQYQVIVGAGGTASDNSLFDKGGNGSNSSLHNNVALGGGGGGGGDRGDNGGSGGGSGVDTLGGLGLQPTSPSSGFGNNGGSGAPNNPIVSDPTPAFGGGGGGAGQPGTNGTNTWIEAKGGDGAQSAITGTTTYYAGGGGAAWQTGTTDFQNIYSAGGLGGGGSANGRSGSTTRGTATPGGMNTGGGGGGNRNAPGINAGGGSGIVVVKYPITSYQNLKISGGSQLIFTGSEFSYGARSKILPLLNGYIEIKINQFSNVNVGLCRASSLGEFLNIPSINLETGKLEGSGHGGTILGKFESNDTLQILYDSHRNLVYFGKNNKWTKEFKDDLGDSLPQGVDPLQIILLPSDFNRESSLTAEFKPRSLYTYSSPERFVALGGDIAQIPIVIGAGGAGLITTGANGSNTTFLNTIALGGGGGGSFNVAGRNGGCGGGAGGRNTLQGGVSLQLQLGYGFGSPGGASAPTTVAGTNAGGGGGSIYFETITTSNVAVGGVESIVEENSQLYRVHVFNASSQFIVNSNVSAECLIVAGGGATHQGGDGNSGNGGGGGGGLIHLENINFNEGKFYTIVVGSGGSPGSNGNNSGIFGEINGIDIEITAIGGGKGGGFKEVGNDGGSGGGGGGRINTLGGLGLQPTSPSSGFGNNGGQARSGDTAGQSAGGGGGGAGADGSNGSGGSTTSVGGNGGNGLQFSITGIATFYAGGGGAQGSTTGGLGGLGGGGNGGTSSGNGTNGVPNTGGGGGGRRDTAVGGQGGSGIVIIRYPVPENEELNSFTLKTSTIDGFGQNANSGQGGSGGLGVKLFDEFIYGAGGGGAGQTSSGTGGSTFAGEGASSSTLTGVLNAIENTGSGGGGSWSSSSNGGIGGNGGSGVAFIRYRIK
jgi:6-phosphogluconolactonase (cycloisomerase 2 family)